MENLKPLYTNGRYVIYRHKYCSNAYTVIDNYTGKNYTDYYGFNAGNFFDRLCGYRAGFWKTYFDNDKEYKNE